MCGAAGTRGTKSAEPQLSAFCSCDMKNMSLTLGRELGDMRAWPGQSQRGLVPGSDFPGAGPPVVRPHESNKGLSVVYFRLGPLFLAPFSALTSFWSPY